VFSSFQVPFIHTKCLIFAVAFSRGVFFPSRCILMNRGGALAAKFLGGGRAPSAGELSHSQVSTRSYVLFCFLRTSVGEIYF